MDEIDTRNLVDRVRKILEENGSMDRKGIAGILGVGEPLLFEAFGWMSRENSIVLDGRNVWLRSQGNGGPRGPRTT
jgi:hypothetical protein